MAIPTWPKYTSDLRAMMLEVTELNTYYGYSHILHGVSLTVKEGEVLAGTRTQWSR